MSEVVQLNDHIMIVADYHSPQPHNHLAYHIILSLGGEVTWKLGDDTVVGRGMCIGPDVVHTGEIAKEGMIIFLFTEMSIYTQSIRKDVLKEKSFAILPDAMVEKALAIYRSEPNSLKEMDEEILKACNLTKMTEMPYDKRVCDLIHYIEDIDSIDPNVVEDISQKLFVSKSRLSHLFKEETGMTLHSYLAFEKLRKTSKYVYEGCSITDACLKAGFNSSSHCASTCKRMFGISLREVY